MRTLVLLLGVLVLACAWVWPLPALPNSFSVHMTMHMAVVAVAAPLVALGFAETRLDPVRRIPALFSPLPASVVELVVVWGWHAPELHELARHSNVAFTLEQASFLASGLLLWLAVLGGDASSRANRAGSGVLALLLTSMHMTLLGALLALPPRPLYAHVRHAAKPVLLSPLEDQHLGGAIMLLVGGLSYLIGGLAVAVRLLRAARSGRPNLRSQRP